MRKIKLICSVVILLLSACGGNTIERQKDFFPDIPNFPQFKDDVLRSEKVIDLRLELGKSYTRKTNSYYFNYLVKDSLLYIITYFSDREFPKIPLNEEYIVDLLVVGNKQPVKHFRSYVNDFAINFDIDTAHNIILGKRKYLYASKYLDYDEIPPGQSAGAEEPGTFKEWIHQGEEADTTGYFHSFDRSIAGSSGHIAGGVNSGYRYQNSAVYLVYYKLKYKDKEGLTKINYNDVEAPLFIRVNEEIYYISYHEDGVGDQPRLKEYHVYKIKD